MTLKDILSSVMGSSEIQDHESDDLGEPTVSVTVSDNPGQLFTILEKEVARVRSNVQVPQEDSEEVIKNSSSDSIVYTEIGNCKIPGDRYEPAISDVCWVTGTSFVVADTKNNAAKIFDDKNNFLWKVEAQNVKNVACIDGVVACDSKTHVLLNSEKGCHGKIYFGPFSSNPFELMHGLEVRRIYIAQHGMSTLRVYTKEGKRHGTVQFDTNVSPIYLVQGKEGSINLIDRSSKSVKRVSKTGNLSTLYTHSQDWSPTAMAINNTNEIYIVDSKTSRLLKISESGKFLSSKDLPIENPVGLSISAKGRFIVCKQNGTACVFGDW
ncbi:hypothetical protein FSP39_014335 [Pinctada imbricata]|uniref:Uncharacterized protein n=1 Tax=Pinctada imbricata TaxID=66713 RepID=A0AA88XR45_PINIB|nr:hypothetical protein FSP39_014335 [Pinctada imbricata]